MVIVLLMASVTLMAIPVQAQFGYWTNPTNPQSNGSVLLAAGVTPDVVFDVVPYLSFRPNPVGVGQTVLVNMWITPGPAVSRYVTGYKVTITKPDGTTDVQTLNSYYADGTAWFEYVVDQVGEWKLKFDMPGAYWPAGNYTIPEGVSNAGFTESFSRSLYYPPVSTEEQTLTVQEEQVLSWPPSSLPTDYWTRPVEYANREWAQIAGDYPWRGPGGGTGWPANTDTYWTNSQSFIPYVQAPNSAHIVWKRRGAISGILGGQMGYEAVTTAGGNPNIIFQGFGYQAVTKPFDGVTQSVWQCYDIRTGEIIWERINVSTPSYIEYDVGASAVAGAVAQEAASASLVYIGGGYLRKYNPTTGAMTLETQLPTNFVTNNYYMNGYVLSEQMVNETGGPGVPGSKTAGIYRLINWTTFGASSNFTSRIVSNITWPGKLAAFGGGSGTLIDSKIGVQTGVREVNFFDPALEAYPYYDPYYDNATGFRYGTRIEAWSLTTGALLWNKTLEESTYQGTTNAIYDGKIAVVMKEGYGMVFDMLTGKLLYKTEKMDYPWDEPAFGAYAVATAYGLWYRFGYGGIYAFDWETGKIAWKYEAPALSPYETPYTGATGTTVYSWNGGGTIADGKLYAYNTEHTPTAPITRGWGIHCINATTGEGIWNISTPGASVAADGYLSVSCNDGYQYVFGKGKSATTIEAPLTAITQGQSLVLTGSVLDQSPGQPGTPCVSKESMRTQMEYLHLQMPIAGLWGNETITGVPVSLDTVDPNGNCRHIADVTTDGYSGTFGYTWTPDVPGQYTVTATFMGDDSYGSSFAQTYISVSEAPAATATPEPPQAPPDTTLTIIVTGIAIILAVAIVGLLILRKRP